MEVEQPINQNIPSEDIPSTYFNFNKLRDSPDQVRNALLVVAALVAAASYQAVVNPPSVLTDGKHHFELLVFIYANTLAWSGSMTIVEILTDSFPLKVEVRLAIFSMAFAYGFLAVPQAKISSGREYVLLILCLFAPYLIRKVVTYKKNNCG